MTLWWVLGAKHVLNPGSVNKEVKTPMVFMIWGAGPSANTVVVDLARSNSTAFGIRFGWQGGGDGCALQTPGNFFCAQITNCFAPF